MSRVIVALILLAASVAAAQSSAGTVWQPPTFDLPETPPKASIPKEMITSLRIGKLSITLEETLLRDVARNLGGTIGSSGDAGDALHWLCLHGSDASGRWALWLESDEMGGGRIDGFALQRISSRVTVDPRCRAEEVQIDLPLRLRIGLKESEVRKILGSPTAKYRNTLIFDHEHEQMVRNEPFTVSNSVYVILNGDAARGIHVWKTTSN